MGDKPQEDSQEEIDNPLCTRLIELWSQGHLSASQVAEICHLSMLSGCEHPQIVAGAKCGNFGQNRPSTHRDMVAAWCKKIHIAEPHMVKVPVKDPKTQREGTEEVALMLPHLVFSNLSHEYPDNFEAMFAITDCKNFWGGMEKCKDPRLVSPITLTKGKVDKPEKTVPLFVHGDGCEFQTRDSLMTWSFGSLLSKNTSLSPHILLTAVPKSCTLKETWKPLDKWISWSFAALTKGMHPDLDPWGKPLTKGLLAELAGQPLTKGHHRGVLWSIQGDQEFYSNVLQMGHWNSQYPCHECDAQKPVYKKTPCPAGKSVKLLKEDERDWKRVSPAQAAPDKRSSHPLFSIPGVSTALVRGDALHILYSRGIASHLAGSLLAYVCYFDWPHRQQVPPNTRLQALFSRIKELYPVGVTKMTNLRLCMVVDTQRPHKSYPCLESKASECKRLLPCLEIVMKEVLDEEENPIHSTMLGCLSCLNSLIQHFDSVDLFLSRAEYAKGQDLAKRFYSLYSDLHDWAEDVGRKMLNITHKFHTSIHLFENTKYMNFRIHHNFRSEHFVGQISQLGHSCSFGVKSTRLSVKLMDKYRILLHLQLTRPGFACVLEEDADS